MKYNFEYLYTTKAEDSIEVEDIGNVCLQLFNDIGYCWFIDISTTLGECSIKTAGPFHVDIPNYFSNGFSFNLQSLEYKESRIISIVDKFINDARKMITQIIEVDRNEFYCLLDNINFKEMG